MLVALFLPANRAGGFIVLLPSPRVLLPRSLGLCPGRAVALAICVRKALRRLGLRGHHPHPPAPSPASGRGGAARAWRGPLTSGRGGATSIGWGRGLGWGGKEGVEEWDELFDGWGLHVRVFCKIIPAAELDGFESKAFVFEVIEFGLAHQSTLVVETL